MRGYGFFSSHLSLNWVATNNPITIAMHWELNFCKKVGYLTPLLSFVNWQLHSKCPKSLESRVIWFYDEEDQGPFPHPALQNVNSFTGRKIFRVNFTPRKARNARQYWHLNWRKLRKILKLENKCWQLFQMWLVHKEKFYISCPNLTQKGLILKNCMFS